MVGGDERSGGGGEGGIGAFMSCLVGHMDGQVSSPHPKAALVCHVVLCLTLAVGVNVAKGAAYGAVSVAGLLTGRYAGVIAEGVLSKLVLYVVLGLDGNHRFRLRHGPGVRQGSVVYYGWGVVVGKNSMDFGRHEVRRGDSSRSVERGDGRCVESRESRGVVREESRDVAGVVEANRRCMVHAVPHVVVQVVVHVVARVGVHVIVEVVVIHVVARVVVQVVARPLA